MKNVTVKRVFALVLTVALAMGICGGAMAAESSVTYQNGNVIALEPGDFNATDLFDGFKGLMPGDVKTETVSVKNDNDEFDYIKVYLRAEPHGENNAPVAEGIEDIGKMNEFLAQLSMTVENGGTEIYNASPDQADGLASNVYLGTIAKGETITLDVELSVPITLGNEYANCIGEVDWVFTFEGFDTDVLTATKIWSGDTENIPESVEVELYRDDEVFDTQTLTAANQWTYTWADLDQDYTWDVKEVEIEGYTTTYTRDGNQVFITNYKPGQSHGHTHDITVIKRWDGNGKHPDHVTMTLYRGEIAVESVVLSDANRWTYTWENLSGAGAWKVLETNIDGGYVPLYSAVNDVVTVTNTARLAQTGQLNWPIPVLGGLGALLAAYGIYTVMKKRKESRG